MTESNYDSNAYIMQEDGLRGKIMTARNGTMSITSEQQTEQVTNAPCCNQNPFSSGFKEDKYVNIKTMKIIDEDGFYDSSDLDDAALIGHNVRFFFLLNLKQAAEKKSILRDHMQKY